MRVLNISTEFIFYSKISHIWKCICRYMRWYCTLMFVWVTHWSHQCFFLGLVVCVFLISGWFDQVTFYLIPLYHSSYCSKDDTELCCSLSIISLCWSYILSCIFWNLQFLGFVCISWSVWFKLFFGVCRRRLKSFGSQQHYELFLFQATE